METYWKLVHYLTLLETYIKGVAFAGRVVATPCYSLESRDHSFSFKAFPNLPQTNI